MGSTITILNPWDVQSRRIYTADGAWMALYAGQGGGRGYVIYEGAKGGKKQMDKRQAVCYAIDQQGGKSNCGYAKDVMMTLCSDSHGTPHALCYEKQMDGRVVGCDLYNQVLTGDIACALTATMDVAGHTGPKVLVCKQEKSDGTEIQMDEQILVFKERAGKPGGGKGILIGRNVSFTLATLRDEAICYQPEVKIDGGVNNTTG